MRKTKKLVGILLSVVMLTGLFATVPMTALAANFAVDTVVEAEKGKLGDEMQKISDKTASGGSYVIINGLDKLADPTTIDKPDISMTFDIPAEGTYKVFVRMSIETGGNDSFFYRWDKNNWQDIHPGETSGFQWIQTADQKLDKGTHTFEWNHREFGAYVDCFFVTTDASKVPQTMDSVATPKPTPTPSFSGNKDKVFAVAGNGLMIEAEDGLIADPYTVGTDNDASGKKYIVGAGDKPAKDPTKEAGQAEYHFTVDKTANYSIWGRVYVENMGSDSVFIGMDEQSFAYTEVPVSEQWQWFKLYSGSLSQGQHKLRVYMREANMKMDNFIITNQVFTPTGKGEIPANVANMPMPTISAAYAAPPVNPPAKEHPRLLFRKSDIPTIIANMDKAQNATAKARYEELLSKTTDGVLAAPAAGRGNINTQVLNIIEAHAFNYALTGNTESGNMAVTAIQNYLSTVSCLGDATRGAGYVIYVASEVYDWCYPLLDGTAKRTIILSCEGIASGMEIGWPPIKQGAVTSHAGEAQLQRDLFGLAIAVYDERPDIWKVVGGRYYEEFVPVRNFQNTAMWHHQGDSYGTYRHSFDTYGQLFITQMGCPAPLNDNLYKVLYGYLYMRRPDGQMMRDGDTFNDTNKMWDYWNIGVNPFFLDSALGKDPYLKDEYFRQNPMNKTLSDSSPILYLVMNDPDLNAKSIYNLPYSAYLGSPVGMSVARTGWEDGINAPVAIASMKVSEWWFANHHQLDAGHFQLYYKGILASSSGIYEGSVRASATGVKGAYGDTDYGSEHDLGYAKKTIAHNTVLVYDPNEKETQTYYSVFANDGGQRLIKNGQEPANLKWMQENNSETGKVMAHEQGPDADIPAFTYLKGDLTKAYTEKVKDFKRSFMFLNLFNEEVPAALIVFDKVDSAKADFKKTWLLHGVEEPTINGNQTVFRRTYADDFAAYNGKMTVDTLLPENPSITKIGGEGKEFMIGETNYFGYDLGNKTDEGTGWRIEVSPKTAATGDLFLNVMQVSDNDKEHYLPVSKLENEKIVGVQIADRFVSFSKNGQPIKDSFEIQTTGNGMLQYTLADAAAGTWSVKGGGTDITAIASKDGGVLVFEAPAGKYTVTYTGANAQKPVSSNAGRNAQGIYIRYKNRFVYSDVAPTIVDDRTLVPMRAIFERLGAELVWDDTSKTATATATWTAKELGGDAEDITRTIQITNGQTTTYVDGEPVILDVPAQIIDGRFLVPLRFISESFYAKVEWDAFARTAYITPGKPPVVVKPVAGYATILSSRASETDGGNVDTNTWDNNLDTLWAAQGEHYIVYELDREYTVTGVEVVFNPNSKRNAKFEVYTSMDGQDFTLAYAGKGNGEAAENTWEKFAFKAPAKAKYIKYLGLGSEISMWNGVKEIRIKAD